MLETKTIIGVIAIVLTFASYIPYLRDTIKGKTEPHVYSWFLWGFITLIIFALQVSDNGGPGAFVSLAAGLISILIVILGVKQGNKNITKSDKVFFGISLLAIGFWFFAKQPILSAILLTSTGIFALIPTIRKSWYKPNTETLSTYLINTLRHLLALFALQNFSIQTALNPFAWTLANGLVGLMLILRRRQIKK